MAKSSCGWLSVWLHQKIEKQKPWLLDAKKPIFPCFNTRRKVVFAALVGLVSAFYFKKERLGFLTSRGTQFAICMLASYLNRQNNILKSIVQTPQSCEQHKTSCLTSPCQLIKFPTCLGVTSQGWSMRSCLGKL